jgi:MFS family permease
MLKRFHRLLLMFLLVFFSEVCVVLLAVPQTQILEDAICDKYYHQKHPLPPAGPLSRCKVEPIQKELSLIKGWQNSFDMMPGFITALPYATLAEKTGRRFIAALALLGFFASILWIQFICWKAHLFPLRLTWASSMALFIGGGGEVFHSMIFTMASDAVTQERRTTVFVVLGSLSYLAEITVTPIAVGLMLLDPWVPLLTADAIMVALIALIALIALAFAIPEQQITYQRLNSDADGEGVSSRVELPAFQAHAPTNWVVARHIFGNKTAVAVFLTLLMASAQRSTNDLLLIYASKKFDWKIAQASVLAQVRGTMSLLLSLLILPTAAYLVMKYFFSSPLETDVRLARYSTFLIAVGFIVLGTAPKPAFAIMGVGTVALGSGINGLCKSIAVSLFDASTTAIVLSAVAMQQTVGAIIAGPLFSYLYAIGLGLGRTWIGLPFVVLGALFLICCVGLSLGPIAQRKCAEQEER